MAIGRRIRRLIVWLVLLGAIAAGATWFMRRDREPEAPVYRTEPAGKGDVTMTVTATGTLSAVTTVQVGSQVSGIVSRLHADFNSRVRQGQLLAELDPTNFEAQVAQRRADLAQAEVQHRNAETIYRRQQRLLAEELAAQEAYDTAKANFETARTQVDQARASLTQAETNLRYTKILSPIDGIVVDRQYDVGQTVAASFQAPTLFTIAQDLTRMQVQADVDQSDIGRLEIGQAGHFTVDAFPEQEFHGRITQIRLNATVSQNVITYPVILAVENPGERLRPKMTADVSIDVATVPDTLRVPNAALRFRPPESATGGEKGDAGRPATAGAAGSAAASPGSSQAGNGPPRGGHGKGGKPKEQTVYVLDGAGKLRPVTVTTGITDGRYTVVTGGDLKVGDAVVIGQPTTRDTNSGRTSFGMSGPGGPTGRRP